MIYDRSHSKKLDSYYRIPSQVAISSKSQSQQFLLNQSSVEDPHRQYYSFHNNTNIKPSNDISYQHQPQPQIQNNNFNTTIPASNTTLNTTTFLPNNQDTHTNNRIKSLANIMMENKERRRLSGETNLNLNK
jgi:hypothetical protein